MDSKQDATDLRSAVIGDCDNIRLETFGLPPNDNGVMANASGSPGY